MKFDFMFLINSIFLGIGLAMDAFSVSLANGMNEPLMNKKKMIYTSGIFGFFQALMLMIGWICVHEIVVYFESFEKFIPWIALILLCFIGGKMLIEGIKNKDSKEEKEKIGFWGLIIQGIATSIDALSVGFIIAEYNLTMAIICALIIAVVTFAICFVGVSLGKKFGTKLSNKATILGGIILICIGIEIFITGLIK